MYNTYTICIVLHVVVQSRALHGSGYIDISTVVWHGTLKELDREDAQKKTWSGCVKDDMESLGLDLSQKDT